jgi:hypothetical protein
VGWPRTYMQWAWNDMTIQRIQRHSNLAVTRACYIKPLPERAGAARRNLTRRLVLGSAGAVDETPKTLLN